MSKANPTGDKRLLALLEDWEQVAPDKAAIVQQVRKLVFSVLPTASERVMYGGIMFTLDTDFGGVFVYKNHVSAEFTNGVHMRDPENLLEGGGKLRRHIKLHSLDDIENRKLEVFIRQVSV